jgi:hypothetical protein
MRKAIFRRLFFACVFAIVPLTAACELAFDFDRTPLQPVYGPEGGSDASEGGRDGGRDA